MQKGTQAEVVRRLKSVEGHVGGIIRMTEADTYCIDVVRQIQAVQAALDRVTALVLENHMNTCLAEAVRGDDPAERERVLAEMVEVVTARSRATQHG